MPYIPAVVTPMETLASRVVLPVLCALWTLSGPAETLFAATTSAMRVGEERAPERLGVQACNTTCQTRHTDCIDKCDGVTSCQAGCNRTVESCVKECSAPPSASAAPPPSAAPTSSAAPAAPAKAKGPAKSPPAKGKS